MRRRCKFIVSPAGQLKSGNKVVSPEQHGWLIHIAVSGNVTFYFLETEDGKIQREHGAYCDVTLLPDEGPVFSEPKKEKANAK